MALTSGTRLGPYSIVAPLGAGGMGAPRCEAGTSVLTDGSLLVARFERMGQPISTMQIVLNWTEELKRLAPAK